MAAVRWALPGSKRVIRAVLLHRLQVCPARSWKDTLSASNLSTGSAFASEMGHDAAMPQADSRPLQIAKRHPAVCGQRAQKTELKKPTVAMLRAALCDLCKAYGLRNAQFRTLSSRCKDCDGAATQWQPSWELTDEAVEWERRLRWPPDGRWTESNWPPEQPFLQLYQVLPPYHSDPDSCTPSSTAGHKSHLPLRMPLLPKLGDTLSPIGRRRRFCQPCYCMQSP